MLKGNNDKVGYFMTRKMSEYKTEYYPIKFLEIEDTIININHIVSIYFDDSIGFKNCGNMQVIFEDINKIEYSFIISEVKANKLKKMMAYKIA